jgi:hypothetical protein
VPKTSPIVAAQAARLDALAASRTNHRAEAASQWLAAIEIAGHSRMKFDEAALRLELCERVPEHAGGPDGLRMALTTFERLRAAPWAARARLALDAATAGPRIGSPISAR